MKSMSRGRGIVGLGIEGEAGDGPGCVVCGHGDRAHFDIPDQHVDRKYVQVARVQDAEVVGLSTLREDSAKMTYVGVAATTTNDVEYGAMLDLDDRIDEVIGTGGVKIEVWDVFGRRSAG